MNLLEAARHRMAVNDGQMRTYLTEVTPAMAQGFLDQNRENRKIQKTYVSQLVGMIQRGEWKITHQGIALAPDGRLLDGQHRCQAIVQAGVTLPMNISYNCDPASFIVLDTGMKRSLQFMLGIHNSEIGAMKYLIGLSSSPSASIGQITNTMMQAALPWAHPNVKALRDSCGSKRRVASSSPILAGAALRMEIVDDRQALLDAYRAFILMEYQHMPPNLQVLERQISSGAASLAFPKMLMIKAFTAFDQSRELQKFSFKSEDAQLQRLHEIALQMRRRANTAVIEDGC